MREFLFYAGTLLLLIVLLIFNGATLHRLDEVENELATVCIQQQEQDHKIELYQQHCDDVARCIVEGEW